MKDLLQFTLIGLGLGSAYALFAQGVVLVYRGSGIVNFAHGSLGVLASYLTFITAQRDHGMGIGVSIGLGVAAAVLAALAFELVVLRLLTRAAPITRLIATLGLLAVIQAGVEMKYGSSNQPVAPFLPHDTFDWGGVRVQEQVLWVIGVTVLITAALWAFTRYSRVGLAITASAQNERAVQTFGWSPRYLSALTWGIGASVAGIAGVLVAPLTGLSTIGFTLVVTVASLAAALLGGFRSFPLTLLGGMVVGIGESLVTLYRADIQDLLGHQQLTGLNRAVPFLIILLVLVVRGRGLPLRSHVSDRLPRLGSGRLNLRGLVVAIAVTLGFLLLWADDRWAAATYVSLASGVVVLSVVVLTGYAGQVSLGQWAIAGMGALLAATLINRFDWPMEIAVPVGVLLTIPAGMLFALPALRTRGVNLAVVTLGLGFTVREVVFANGKWIGSGMEGGTRVGNADLFGYELDAATHPHRWAVVCLVGFVLSGIVVANLRRSRTGRRLIAVRTNERAAASLGISVFGVKLYAFGIAAGIAGLGGILAGFQSEIVTYDRYNVFESINAVGFAVIGGLGYVIGAAFSAPNAIGGLGTRFMEELLNLGDWNRVAGGVLLLVIIVANQDGVADVMVQATKRLMHSLHLGAPDPVPAVLVERTPQPVVPAALRVSDLTVRFGGVTAVDGASFEVAPGEVVGLIGPNGAGKTTVIDAVTGFVKPAAGTIGLDDERIDEWSATRRARRGVRRSFQSLELFEDVTVADNIGAGADTSASKLSWVTDLFWPGRHALPDAAVTAIYEFQLEDCLGRLPGELPYGKRRLVGIARAVASGPSVILLDEPAAGLDDAESRELASLIRRLADERRMGVLLVEHDMNLVMTTCDRIVVLEFGRVIASGTPEEVRGHPDVIAAYLGAPAEGPDQTGAESVEMASQP
jgi:sulfate-transporting ATPase